MKRSVRLSDVLVAAGLTAAAALFCLVMLPFSTVDSQSNFTVEYDTDRRFGDYRNFETREANHMVCQNACASEAKCLAYTYVKPWQEWPAKCWLKDSVPRGEGGLTCCISGVKNGGGGGSAGGKFGGTFDAYHWDTITIEQNGDQATGRYSGAGSGTFRGVVRGDKLYFSWRNGGGQDGEAVMSPIDANAGKYGLVYCSPLGCTPSSSTGYIEPVKRK